MVVTVVLVIMSALRLLTHLSHVPQYRLGGQTSGQKKLVQTLDQELRMWLGSRLVFPDQRDE